MPHECCPCCLQRTRATHRVSPPPRSPDARCAPPPARCLYPRPPRGLHSPCVLSPDPVTTLGYPVPGGCVRGGRQTAPPRRAAGCVPPRTSPRRAAATASTRTHHASPRGRTGRPPARPGARAGRTVALARPASTPWTTRRHSNQRRDTGADGSARYVGGTGRLLIRPRAFRRTTRP